MKERIITYLKGPRTYAEGMTLYEQYGANLRLKATFRRLGETELTRITLLDELRRLAGLSEQQFRQLPRLADAAEQPAVAEKSENRAEEAENRATEAEIRAEGTEIRAEEAEERAADAEIRAEEAEERAADAEERAEEAEERAADAEERAQEAEKRASEAEGNTLASESLKEMVNFRDRFPFLRLPDCPDVLKVIVSDLFAAYDRYRAAHAALAELPDDADRKQAEQLAAEAVENYLQDRALLEELEHYRDHGTLLGRHPTVAAFMQTASLKDLSDLDVEKIRKNAASNASKWRKKLEKCTPGTDDHTRCTDNFRRWELTKQESKQELEERKKKNA